MIWMGLYFLPSIGTKRFFVGCIVLPLWSFLDAFFLAAMVYLLLLEAAPMGVRTVIRTSGANLQTNEVVSRLHWNVEEAMAGLPRRRRAKAANAE